MTRGDRSPAGALGLALALVCMGAGAAVLLWSHSERQRLPENERSAIGTVGAISSALAFLQDPARKPRLRSWTLAELHEAGVILAEVSAADPGRPGATPYRGYWFTILQGPPGKQTPCAYPARYGRTGNNTFIRHPDYGHLKKDTGGIPPPDTPSEKTLRMEWSKYD